MQQTEQPTPPSIDELEEKIEEIMRIPAKQPSASLQIKLRPRHFPPAPGFVPVPVDIIITMTIQFALVVTNFLVIFISFAYDGDDLGWIIFFEILFTYIGFAYFIRKLCKHKFIFKKFFKGITLWHDRKLQALEDGNKSCCICRYLLVRLTWWIVVLFEFPIIICWSMWQSYKWHKDRRKNAQSTVDLMDLTNCVSTTKDAKKYWKRHDRAYSVWHLDVLSKQAAIIVMFLQDIPLLVLSLYIANYLGIVVYVICIILKFSFWIKHMFDMGTLTLFYKSEDYLDHFGIKSIYYEQDEFGCGILLAEFYTDWMREMSTLQIGDWVKIYNEINEEYKVMIVWKIKYFTANENLVLIDYNKVDRNAIDALEKGSKKLMIEPKENDIHYMNSFDFFVANGTYYGKIELLRDDEYIEYHDHDKVDKKEEEAVEITTEVSQLVDNNDKTQNNNDAEKDVVQITMEVTEEEAVQITTKDTQVIVTQIIDNNDSGNDDGGHQQPPLNNDVDTKIMNRKEYQSVSVNDTDDDVEIR